MAQSVKNLPGIQEMQVQSMGWEDPSKGIAMHSSILASGTPRTEEPGGPPSVGSQRFVHN